MEQALIFMMVIKKSWMDQDGVIYEKMNKNLKF